MDVLTHTFSFLEPHAEQPPPALVVAQVCRLYIHIGQFRYQLLDVGNQIVEYQAWADP
jgi:hypothetical protein